MELFTIRDLTFSYPEQHQPALRSLSLTVEQGEFLVLCGPSGCGKSTLLRQLKTVLAPHGRRTGELLLEGRPLDSLSQREQAERIGFVQQSPENQLVTDKVWHELAFGLESLGYDTPTIRRRVAEMASFFGIQNWFHKNVAELSGGQKQLLNLAAVMALQPSVLILDEPTSQLDPIAASDFLATLSRINRELGTTVILTEHRLEEAFGFASRVAVLEKGALLCTGTPAEVGAALKSAGSAMFLAMPAAMRIWSAVDSGAPCPVSVRDGRRWLLDYAAAHPLKALPEEGPPPETEALISARELWFKYDQDRPDVVKGLSLEVRRGQLLALLGSNGTGKTTSLKLLAGLKKPWRGELEVRGTVGMLPQDPQTLFVRPTVREDLLEVLPRAERKDAALERVVSLCRLTELLDRHPYDLSGGEQQRAALAKLLLRDPDILLLDEPTKGLDAEFKQSFGQILQTLQRSGVAILMVSHDIEFCAKYADRCALFFDGNIVTEGPPRAFFSGNSFYTTAANRMARELLPRAVTTEDVIAACGGKTPDTPALPEYRRLPPAPEKEAAATRSLPVWRKALAAVSGLGALALIVQAIRVTDLSKLIGAEGMTALAGDQLLRYAALAAALLVFALSVGQKAERPGTPVQTPVEKRRLRKRTAAATVLILLLIPLTQAPGPGACAHRRSGGHECGGPRGLFHAAGVQARCRHDHSGGRGLWRRDRLSGGGHDHAGLQYALFSGAMDALADVCHGHCGLAGRRAVSEGRFAEKQAEPLRVWRVLLHGGLWRHHESRFGPDVGGQAQLAHFAELLYHGHPGGSGPGGGHGGLFAAGRRAHAGKAGPDQDQIRPGGMNKNGRADAEGAFYGRKRLL